MLKYLPGILIIQIATVAMALAVIKSADRELWLAVLLLALIISLVTAFWFASIASHAKKDALARAKDEFHKEREKLRVNAERQKTSLMRKSHEEIRKETNRVHARSSFKLGAGFIGIVAAGSLMIFSQFITLGLLTLAVGGGALGGYLMRVRQEVVSRRKEALAISDERKPVIEVQPVNSDPS
jgi:mannitol-specific phosphotransferase system IIBC component